MASDDSWIDEDDIINEVIKLAEKVPAEKIRRGESGFFFSDKGYKYIAKTSHLYNNPHGYLGIRKGKRTIFERANEYKYGIVGNILFDKYTDLENKKREEKETHQRMKYKKEEKKQREREEKDKSELIRKLRE